MTTNSVSIKESNIEVKLSKNENSKKESGTIILKLTSEEVKKFIVSGYPNSKELKLKLPLKLKLSNNSKDGKDPSKLSAKLILRTDQKKGNEEQKVDQIQKQDSKSVGSQSKSEALELNNQPVPSLNQQVPDVEQPNPLTPIEQGDEVFLKDYQMEQIQEVYEWKTLKEFITAIIEEINTNHVYGTLLDRELIVSILLERSQSYLNYEQVQQLLSLVFDILALSKNQGNQSKLPTSLQKRNFAQNIGSQLKKLKYEIFTANKNILKILDYMQPKSQNQGSRYTHCFLDLKFDFSHEQLSKVAQAVKYQCRYNPKAFFFLTNYLAKSCRKLQEENACIKEIDDTLVNAISKLIKENPPSTSIEGDQSLLFRHPSYQIERSKYPVKYLNFKNVPQERKFIGLENFIFLRAKEAVKNSSLFSKLIIDVCSKEGSNLTTGVKLKGRRNLKAINRIREKILDRISSKFRAEIMLNSDPNLSIDGYTNYEYYLYRKRTDAFIESIQANIEFEVDDLLRGRCIFSSIDKLNKCCSDLKIEIEKRGFKLLALLNRLKEKTGDIILHIQIGGTIAEMQLIINYKHVQNEFYCKLEHLRNAQFYSHITHLKQYHQKLTQQFFEEIFKFITANSNKKETQVRYNEKIEYAGTGDIIIQFTEIIPFQPSMRGIDMTDFDISMFASQIQRFNSIKSTPVSIHLQQHPETNKHNGDYLYELSNYDQAEHFYEQYCKQIEQKYSNILSKVNSVHFFNEEEKNILKNYAGAVNALGKIHMRKKNFDKSIEQLQESEKLIKIVGNRDQYIADTLKNLGEIEYRRNNLSKSIEIYKELLNFEENSSVTSLQQHAQTLMNIALVYRHQGNYFEALKNFRKSLEILEKEKGKEHILLANVYNNLGAIYNLQGNLSESLTNYKISLEIIEKEKGKNSFDCASVLGNIALIYENDGNYYEAINNYEKSVIICSRHNVREIIYANSTYGLGTCYSSLKNFTKAIEYFKKALEIYGKNKNQIYFATLTDIAVAYENLGDDEKANQYYDLLQSHQ